MVKRVVSLLRQDFMNTLRDNMLLYMLVGPILLAVAARAFMPSVDEMRGTFAVQRGFPTVLAAQLEQYGTVEWYATADAVAERVRRSDDVPGFVVVGNTLRMILEGNEREGVQGLHALAERMLSSESLAEYTIINPPAGRSTSSEYVTIALVMLAAVLGAMVMAFVMIEDKESRAIRALGVSPLSIWEFTLARGLFAVGIGAITTAAVTAVLLGSRVNYGLLMAAYLMCVGVPVLSGFIIGGLADTQLKAIAILKFFMLVYLTLPMVSMFVPREWHVVFYPLPNYWMWTTYENLFVGQSGAVGFWAAGAITFAISLVLIVLALPRLRRQWALR
jgi:ABC-2 type transport system permease protein